MGGLQAIAKTARAASLMRTHAAAAAAAYSACWTTDPRLLPLPPAPAVEAAAAAAVSDELAATWTPAATWRQGLWHARVRTHAGADADELQLHAARDATGVHLARVALALPPAFAELQELSHDAAAAVAFEVQDPSKLAKLLRRERLHADRRAAQQQQLESPSAATGAGDAAQQRFMDVTLARAGAGQLAPRPSSECVVRAAVERASAAAAAEGVGVAPRLLVRGRRHGCPATPPKRRGDHGTMNGSCGASPCGRQDLGCGTGALLLSALHLLRAREGSGATAGATGVGLDIDAAALADARVNAAALGELGAVWARGDFGKLHQGGSGADAEAALRRRPFHAVLCNPPYLRTRAGAGRATGESARALYGGEDGLRAYAALAASLGACDPPLLSPGGALCLQLSGAARAAAAVEALFAAQRFVVVARERDGRGVLRCLVLQRSN